MGEKKQTGILVVFVIIMILLGGALVHLFITGINPADKNKNTGETALTEQELKNEFEISFLKLENNNQNMIYSPLSIKFALKMLEEGAEGTTKEEIEDVINGLEFKKYKNIQDVLSFANCLYIREDLKQGIKESYKTTLIQKYDAEVNYDSFENEDNVNKWIEDKTLGMIKKMLKSDDVQDAVAILINSLAIDMEWSEEFDLIDTSIKPFYLQDGTTIKATMMAKKTTKESTSYYKDDEITALTMSLKRYADTQLEFVGIMPNTDLSTYIKNLSINDIKKINRQLKSASEVKSGVIVTIPKFAFEYDLDLKNDMNKLGINTAFTPNANYSNITEDGFYVNKALHKANIEFSEEGIKAAATTSFVLTSGLSNIGKNAVEITFDKPFLFIIRDKATKDIWFVGTVYNPNGLERDI